MNQNVIINKKITLITIKIVSDSQHNLIKLTFYLKQWTNNKIPNSKFLKF